MKKQGLIKGETEGAYDFAKRAIKKLPQHKVNITVISDLYQKLRYRKASEKQIKHFKNRITRFHIH